MNEWGVVGVVIALVGFIISVTKPIVSLTRTITELTVVVRGLRTDMDAQKNRSHEEHKRIWDHEDKQDKQITDHEKRIVKLEKN